MNKLGQRIAAVTIFTNALGRPYASPGALGTCFGDALRKAELDSSLHGLRRYAAKALSSQGHSSRSIAKWMGWAKSDAEDMASTYIDDEAAQG